MLRGMRGEPRKRQRPATHATRKTQRESLTHQLNVFRSFQPAFSQLKGYVAPRQPPDLRLEVMP